MGHGITVESKSCNYEDTFSLGIGMMYFSLENVISLVSPHRREKVLNLLKRQDSFAMDYDQKMFVCPSCNTLAERFDFSIAYGAGQIYKPYFRCPKCRKKLVSLEEAIESTSCPQCGEKTLISTESVLWD